MKLLLCILAVVVSLGLGVNSSGVCPPDSGLAGICVFDPDVNCLDDAECAEGYKCCSEGCGKICKKALSVQTGDCPEPSGLASICVFKPGRNCLSDSDCGKKQKCCSEGCGKVCLNVK